MGAEIGWKDEHLGIATAPQHRLWFNLLQPDRVVLQRLIEQHFAMRLPAPQFPEMQLSRWEAIAARLGRTLSPCSPVGMIMPVMPDDESHCLAALKQQASNMGAQFGKMQHSMASMAARQGAAAFCGEEGMLTAALVSMSGTR